MHQIVFSQILHNSRALLGCAAALIIAFAALGCDRAFAADDPFAPYRQRGIVVAQEADMAPMSFKGLNGEPKGYVIDLWRKWSAETGVPVHFHLMDWADTLTAVRDGKADVHGGLFFTVERDGYLDYTTAFFPSRGGLFVTDDSAVAGVDKLRGRRVGVVEGSFYHGYMTAELPDLVPVPIKTAVELAAAADRGEVDAFLADYPTLMHQLGAMGKTARFRVVEFFSEQEFRAAVAEGDFRTLGMVEAGLALIDEEERTYILNRWIVSEGPPTSGWLYPLTMASVAVLLLAIAAPFFFNRFPRDLSQG